MDVIDLLKSTLQLVQYDFSISGIEVEKEYPDSLPPVFVAAGQIQQVFLNLLTNARQAVEGRDNAKVRVVAKEENNKIIVSVEDNGSGIPEKVQARIFDPFYTTKPVGKGTGLGLSISYGILKRQGGSIYVESEENKGSRFIIKLPVYKK